MGIRHSVNVTFFDTWTPAMAYVLGFIYADGNIDRCPNIRASYVNIFSTDKEIVFAIKRVMQSEHIIHIRKPRGASRKPFYILRIGSAQLCDALERHGVFPNKSLTIQFPVVPKAMLPHFVRGYFDGDGCVHIEQQRGRTTKRLRTIFSSGSKEFLVSLEEKLRLTLGFKHHIVSLGAKAFDLRYSSVDSMKLFDFMYKKPYDELYLERKKRLFENFIRPRRQVDKTEICKISIGGSIPPEASLLLS